MDLIEALKQEEPRQRPPGKTAVSAYLTERQQERLDALVEKSGLSQSKTIGRIIDLFYEQTRGGAT